MTRLLVITPGFHGYGESIADAFRRLDHEVTVHRYDAVPSTAIKVWNKARYETVARVRGTDNHLSTQRATRGAVQAVRGMRPDVVLVIRGDLFDPEFWQVAAAGGRPTIVWLYDEIRRTPRFDVGVVAQHARLVSYSPHDSQELSAQGFETTYVPTAFDDLRPVAQHSGAEGVVSFVGAPLPGRVAALRALMDAGVPVRAWGRGWSDHPVDRARTWRVRSRGIPNHRDVPGDVSLSIMRDSVSTLNVHGDQDGFTMRTFESCAVGGVQLIDRPDVSEFYEPGSEVLVFTSDDELIDHARHVLARPGDFDDLRRRARDRTFAQHTFVHRARALERLW
ncbi:CgeB family protein [Rudaeicoccus suwonensis]|uniref:Spore maturation protein CgeB n=1 Tax=Rudaeicoccus suwonensis TaxID=657409 RepID=A0A561E8Q5_9MICO|nr:glycosyltransferase [Rudaeicoccus suwonensis]TWE11986.1 spore maturation protein CgeB [Rudaeicoccus suwonensis]